MACSTRLWRPILGLLPALEGLVAEINRRGSLRVTLQVKGRQRRLPDEVELTLFRITQEALNNVMRHAEAVSAMVEVEILPNRLHLAVRDDGKGFDFQEHGRNFAAEGKLGLVGMRERAELIDGTLEMCSSPGQGTRVEVKVPC